MTQAPPRKYRSPRQKAAIELLFVADALRRYFSAVFESNGDVTAQQYNVLRILRGAGGDGLPTLQIAERMIEQVPGITRLLDRLEKKKLIVRRQCTEDRRRVLCGLSESGTKLLQALDEPVSRADDDALRVLSNQEVVVLNQLLGKIWDDVAIHRQIEAETPPKVDE